MALSQATEQTQLLIDGEERPTAESFPVRDPHDGSVIGQAAAASAEQAEDAVRAQLLGKMKRGAYLVNTARGRIVNRDSMTPHTSGTPLSAQARYAAGTREILECFLEDRPIRDEYLIVKGGALAGSGAHSYSAGSAGRRASQGEDAEPSS